MTLMVVRFVEKRVKCLRIVRVGELKNKGRREFNQMVQVKGPQGGNDSSHSSLGVHGKVPLLKSWERRLN